MSEAPAEFEFWEAPDHPGWYSWRLDDPTRFNNWMFPELLLRRDPDGKARLRFTPERHHTNLQDALHGGVILSLVDVALFGCSRMLGIVSAGTAVTLDLSVQFIGAGRGDQPCDAVAEVLRETGRLVFLRGLIEQDQTIVAAFSGTIRKPSR